MLSNYTNEKLQYQFNNYMFKLEQKEIIGIAALLIHAAKIDEIYSEKEKKIILSFVKSNLNGTFKISNVGVSTFTFDSIKEPQRSLYTSLDCDELSYSTTSGIVTGAIESINIVSGGGGGGGTSIPYDKMTVAQKIEYDKAMRGI